MPVAQRKEEKQEQHPERGKAPRKEKAKRRATGTSGSLREITALVCKVSY